MQKKLGEGAYGVVYQAKDLKRGLTVAIKTTRIQKGEEGGGIPSSTLREVAILKYLDHPNIVKLHDVIFLQRELYLVFEFVEFDLSKFLNSLPPKQNMGATLLKKFAYSLTEGIRFCHSRRILHRDLKPANILISRGLELKIADFGLGREHRLPIQELTHEVVTLWYRPPDILLGTKRYSGSVDVWGIGCILAEMATKLPLFTGNSEIDQLFQIYQVLGTPNLKTWPGIKELPFYSKMGPQWKPKNLANFLNESGHHLDADGMDLLEKTLRLDPKKRISAKRMLEHRWFDGVRDEFGRSHQTA